MPTKKPQSKNADHPNTPAPLRVWARLLWGQAGVRVAPQYRGTSEADSPWLGPDGTTTLDREDALRARCGSDEAHASADLYHRTCPHGHDTLTISPDARSAVRNRLDVSICRPDILSDRPWLDQAFHGQAARSETSAG